MIKIKRQRGNILVLALFITGLILTTVLIVIGGAQLYFENAKYSINSEKATALAEGGIDKALVALNATGGSYTGENETEFADGSFSIVVTNKSSTTKVIESTGYIPKKTNPKVKKTIKVEAANGIGTAFNYGVQVGEGGLTVAKDSIIEGSVYSNGNINLEQDTEITGDAYVAGGTQPSPDQQSDCGANCGDYIFGKDVGGQSRLDVAQSFKPTLTAVINKVGLKIKKVGSPPNLTVRILGDNNGKPNKNNVLASGTLYANLVTTEYPSVSNLIEVAFTSPPTLTANNTYWIMLDTSSNSSNYWSWSSDLSLGYTGGSPSWSPNWNVSNPSWTGIGGDLGFKTFMGGVVTYIDGDIGADIGGDAHANTLKDLAIAGGAYYQVSQNITAGSLHPGSQDPAVVGMPISQSNIDDWKEQAQDIGTYNGNISSCPSTLNGKYVGDINLPEGCIVTVGSPVWVTGDLNMAKDSKLRLNASFGSSSGVFMVDNFITLDKDNKILGSGTEGSYLILMSNFNSKDDPQQRAAILVAKEGNTGVLYSNFGIISIAKVNDLTSITAWGIDIAKETIITYDLGLAGTFFTSGPSGSFAIVKGTYQVK